jgi:hypothetical protein
MRLIIRPNASSVAEWVSRYVAKRIKDFEPTADVRRPPSRAKFILSLVKFQMIPSSAKTFRLTI